MFEILTQTPVFKKLEANEIEKLLQLTPYKTSDFSRGDILGMSGEVLKGLSIIVKGSVRGEMLDFSGKAITIENIVVPNMIAPAFLFGKNARLPVDVIANEDCTILYIAKSHFVKLLQSDERLLSNFLNIISGRTQFLAEKINFLSFKSIREKYLHYLTSIARQENQKKFKMTLTQNQLSELFGVSRPALAKVISELNEEGIVNTKGKNVEILSLSFYKHKQNTQ